MDYATAGAGGAATAEAGGRDGSVGHGRLPVRDKGVDPELNFTSMVGSTLEKTFLRSDLPLKLGVEDLDQHVHRSLVRRHRC